ncbi:hypothetical protein AB0K11_15435 [Mycobacterium sp. NPDC050551]|uniref:hypothetical protein n=1 Tax=Mycobacterium sp. NPDC050551 TaxID=3155407 RepID=UPI003428AF12
MLAATVLVDGVFAFVLAMRDFELTRTASSTLGAGLLLAIAVVCMWAFVAILRKSASWLTAVLLSQISIAFFAGYVWLIDLRSPVSQLTGWTGFVLTLGATAVVWIVYLGPHARATFTRGVAVLAAVVPLLGLFQYWLDTDYLPRTSRPLIDVQADLTPIGNTGHIVHLLAKVTLHNRGTVQADIGGTLMRVTAYPRGGEPQAAGPVYVAAGIDLSGTTAGKDFRADPTPAAAAQLVYADDFDTAGAFLLPGMQIDYKKVVDIDIRQVGLARLSVSAAFITQRRVTDTRSCLPPRVSQREEPDEFSKEVAKLVVTTTGAGFLCVENEIAPRNVVHDLVSDHPLLRVYLVINDPIRKGVEYPQLLAAYGTRSSIDDGYADPEQAAKIDDANPTVVFRDVVAEYAPKDADVTTAGAFPPS